MPKPRKIASQRGFLRAVAVELDLVNPASAQCSLLAQRRVTRFDNPENGAGFAPGTTLASTRINRLAAIAVIRRTRHRPAQPVGMVSSGSWRGWPLCASE
jgi:hypothetical protein